LATLFALEPTKPVAPPALKFCIFAPRPKLLPIELVPPGVLALPFVELWPIVMPEPEPEALAPDGLPTCEEPNMLFVVVPRA
jgi:hypothetical protein